MANRFSPKRYTTYCPELDYCGGEVSLEKLEQLLPQMIDKYGKDAILKFRCCQDYPGSDGYSIEAEILTTKKKGK